MVSERKFYKTIISVEVLSEEPLGDIGITDLSQLHYMVTDGYCVGRANVTEIKEINGKETADELYELSSEPGFFMLDDEGNDTEGIDDTGDNE